MYKFIKSNYDHKKNRYVCQFEIDETALGYILEFIYYRDTDYTSPVKLMQNKIIFECYSHEIIYHHNYDDLSFHFEKGELFIDEMYIDLMPNELEQKINFYNNLKYYDVNSHLCADYIKNQSAKFNISDLSRLKEVELNYNNLFDSNGDEYMVDETTDDSCEGSDNDIILNKTKDVIDNTEDIL